MTDDEKFYERMANGSDCMNCVSCGRPASKQVKQLRELLREAQVAIDAYIVCMRLGPNLVDFEMAQRNGLDVKPRIDAALGEK